MHRTMATAPAQAMSTAGVTRTQTTDESKLAEWRWQPVLGLPCQLTVDLPLAHFKVADFLALQAGSVIPTEWRVNRDVPLRINGTLIAWGEFEGASGRLAVRITELA
jgi:flagellar motor switch/type III secretory pathway protein FliN